MKSGCDQRTRGASRGHAFQIFNGADAARCVHCAVRCLCGQGFDQHNVGPGVASDPPQVHRENTLRPVESRGGEQRLRAFEFIARGMPFLREKFTSHHAFGRGGVDELLGEQAKTARRLQANYGLSREAVAFWDIHEMADAEHSEVGDNIVVHHATDAATQARVRDALQHSLDAWWQFFDGIQAAI